MNDIVWPEASCCDPSYPGGCVCLPMERALRGWIRGVLPPMTDEQREACLDEIGKVEGYSTSDHKESSDSDLARAVLYAWTDYARDKGLL